LRGSGNATPSLSTYDTLWVFGALGVTTATGALLGAGVAACELLPALELVSLDGTEPADDGSVDGVELASLGAVSATEPELLVSALVCACAPAASLAPAGAELVSVAAPAFADVAATSTLLAVPVPPLSPPPEESVNTGALKSTAHIRVSTKPLELRPRSD
jgi:hypothetical protein